MLGKGAKMTYYQKLGIIIYIFLIIEGAITSTALYMKAKKTPVLYSLLANHIAVVAWLVFASIEIFSIGTKFFLPAAKLSLLPIMMIGSLWFVFVLYYTDKVVKKSRAIVWIIIIIPIISYVLIWFNKCEYMLIGYVIPDTKIIRWGPLFYIITIISFIYVILGSIFIIVDSFKKKSLLWQNMLLVSSVLFMVIVCILAANKVIPTYGFDPSPITFSVVLGVISLLVFKYKAIDVIPIAYFELFNYINSAVIIIDRDGKIDDYNKTFLKYFDNLICTNSCKDIYTFLAMLNKYSDDKNAIAQLKEIFDTDNRSPYEIDIKINIGGETDRQFSINIASLKNVKIKPIGSLIVIRDVTEYRKSTISDERTRLSNDLHDSLGNCINNISSNLEYAIKNFDNTKEIKECIEISYAKATNAFLHLRRIVEELKPVDLENNGLLWALDSMFYKLRIKGIHIEFFSQNVDDKIVSGMKHAEAIYFICQEAINNSLVHGKAESITITLIQSNRELKLYISDDGDGCDSIKKGRGLNSIEQRVYMLGGTFVCGSPSDGGFNIRILLPLEYD